MVVFLTFPGTSPDAEVLGKFCGKEAHPVRSTGNTMAVYFHTDTTKVSQGFLASYFIGE